MTLMYFFVPIPSQRAAEDTPADRDRVVDAARAFSLLIVVIGHALMAVVAWRDGVPKVGNLLAVYPWAQAITWILQIMPLFYFAGGAANTISWDKHLARGEKYPTWMWTRTQRLLRPLWVYLTIAGCIAALVSIIVPTRIAVPLMFLMTQLLWFLGSYILVTALTPLFHATNKKRGALIIFGLLLVVALVDSLRLFADWPSAIGLVNFVLVWTIPAYLGSLRARGTMAHYSRFSLVSLLFFNLFTNVLLIKFGPWPLSLVGMPKEPITNMAPPSIVIAIHSLTLVALLSLFNGPLTRLLSRPKIWRPVTGVNLVAMTLYLWHLPLLVGLVAATHYLGWDRPTRVGATGYPVPDGWRYGLESVGFWVLFAVTVWVLVRLMWVFEHVRLPWWDSSPQGLAPRGRWVSIFIGVGVLGVGISLLMLSATGLGGFPTRVVRYLGIPLNAALAMGILVGSGALIRWAGARRSP
ncbi:MAG: acyltransferase [Candidatus Nanopelagicaceae bacterium]|nr:acyltransferase [Candidatus Nanopelagicaceae bacterium]